MAQLNENLIRAMVWDLKEVVNVSITLSSWMGKIDCMSWRYPSKQSQSVDVLSIFKNLNGSAGEYYVNLLEFIYDRLLLILNLLIKFVDNFPNPSASFAEKKNVIRPQQLSLGGLLTTLWSRMQTLQTTVMETLATPRENFEANSAIQGTGSSSNSSNISHTVVSRNCQTDLLSLACCENCHWTERLMVEVITWVEMNSLDICRKSSVASRRQALGTEDLLHCTQWHSMATWTAAIVEDLTSLQAAFKEAKETKVRLAKLLRETEKKWEERAHSSQEAIRKLKTQCRLSEEHLTLKGMELSQVQKKWQEIFSDRENDYKIMGKKLKLTDELLTASEAKEKQMRVELEGLQLQLLAAVSEKNSLADELRDLSDAKLQHAALESPSTASLQTEPSQLGGVAHPITRLPSRPTIKMQGDPTKDMLDQMQANQASIQRLQAENERLAGTLDKLRAFNARNARDATKR